MLRAASLALLVLVPLGSGCVAAATAGVVAVGVVQYERNEVEQDFALALEPTWQATMEALQRLDVTPTVSELGAMEGRAEEGDMVVRVERHPEGFTRVRVRVGTFHTGDHVRRARLVLQEIEAAIQRADELRVWSEKVQGQAESATKPNP